MKNFLLKYWPVVALIVLSGLIAWPLFLPGYFSHHDDLQVMRIFEMRKCLNDLQIPCRWVPDMGYGNGYPLFNFYGVFPYYIGAVVSFFIGYIGAAKFLFFLPLFFGGMTMYFLAKELFGKVPGFVAGVLFLFAPYRALDAYVRGDVAEGFSIALIPLILLLVLRLIKTGGKKYFAWGSIALTAFFLSHNIMTLLFTPIIGFLVLFWLREYKWQNLRKVALVFLLGLGLSAFFIIPAYFEKNLIQTESLVRNELDFRAQFVKISQIFLDRSWNYSGSQPQSSNTISYQIGWPHWWLVVLSLVAVIVSKKRKNILLFTFLFLIFTFATYMTHNKSAFIWEKIPILIYVQFPWRFLSIAIFAASLIGGYFVYFFRGRNLYVVAITVSILAVLLNWQYFRPEHFYYDMTDQKKLTGQNFIDQEKGALLDYLPKTALEPRELAPSQPIVINGKALITNFVNKSNRFSFDVNIDSDSVIDVPVFDFPDWTVLVDGKIAKHSHSFPTGRIEVQVSNGGHKISGGFRNTPVRSVSNLITLVSLVGFIVVLKYGKNIKIYS